MSEAPVRRIDAVLIAGGKYHDIDFARCELLKLMNADSEIRVRVFEDYSNLEAIEAADFLITYTCDVAPSESELATLERFLRRGGRWYALHGTNSVIRFIADKVDTPDIAPGLTRLLGSRFLSHPPIAPYRVEVIDPTHPVVNGIEPFEATDELYLGEYVEGLCVLLATEFEGETPSFTHSHWPRAKHPVLYLHQVGEGAVLYLTLGHCRSHFDMQPLFDRWPRVDRCSWDLPIFYDLLRRGIVWAKASQRRHASIDAKPMETDNGSGTGR